MEITRGNVWKSLGDYCYQPEKITQEVHRFVLKSRGCIDILCTEF